MRIRSKSSLSVSSLLSSLCIMISVSIAAAAGASEPDDGEAALRECPQFASGGDSIAAHIFDMSDTDGDDALSPEEFKAAGLEGYGMGFEAYDVDGDGFTSVDEYFDVFEAHHPPGQMI